jgi:tetratricopeptide (TPR) repeat protein
VIFSNRALFELTHFQSLGHKLGTFCVEGPEPRPNGLSESEKEKLKEYAAKAMALMVDRRKTLRDRLSSNVISDELRRHAAVTTNLGGLLYTSGCAVTAMRLFQESVQTIMHVEGEEGGAGKPPTDRQEAMAQFLTLLSVEHIPAASREELIRKIAALYTQSTPDVDASPQDGTSASPANFIPGLFSSGSKLKGASSPRPLPGLVFSEVFKIDMDDTSKDEDVPDPERPFTVSLGHCSKATLFNMGLVHYCWESPDMALQFFHLAASVSHKMSPLAYDPVDLGCVNNMAQIHLQYGRSSDAMKMLEEALTRGNETLAAMYSKTDTGSDSEDQASLRSDTSTPLEELEARRTRRLRRKLARTVLNMGHVHFYNCEYEAAMATCRDALGLLGDSTEQSEVAAVWFNMSMLFHHQSNEQQAMVYLDKYLGLACKVVGHGHVQIADALYRKGVIAYEIGNLEECMTAVNEALKIWRLELGEYHSLLVKPLGLIGKVHLAKAEYDSALEALTQSLEIQRKAWSDGLDHSFDVAQTLLEVGRAYHAKADLKSSLETYLEVADLARNYFGEGHAFVARIVAMIGNLYAESGQVEESVAFLAEAAMIRKEQGLPFESNGAHDIEETGAGGGR